MHLFFSPSGRIGRIQWWLGWLLPIAILAISLVLAGGLVGENVEAIEAGAPVNELIAVLIMFTFLSTCIWVNICLTVKRYHDRDKSAWWIFIVLVPVIGPIWQIVECGFMPGSPGGNNYGDDTSPVWSDIEVDIAAMWRA
ncbi:MAG: DUF805 domain-containing protein [Hyphomicrobiales bacterium]|nr:DUF805 domain-containing protein [Hyphomicrobiales bacterium]MCP4999418.1 DUF805 domain-containing protein [Hyphomicrobiales bacterium]